MIKWLLGLIKPFEGLHKKLPDGKIGPYICPAGYATQGFGLLVKDMNVPAISEAEAERRLVAALPYYIGETLKLAPNLSRHPPQVLAAVVDFVFNLGAPKFKASTLRRAILAEDWPRVVVELRKWVRGGGRVLPGLVKRRNAEAILIIEALQLEQS